MSTLSPDAPLARRLARQRLLPVLTLTDADLATPLAGLLHEAGLEVVEVTLRTEAALRAIEALAADGRLRVGAGTIRGRDDLDAARDAGACFAVSPGATPALLDAGAEDGALPFIPGVATPGEMMRAADHGFLVQKFFPAGALGGPEALRSVAGPLPDLRFVPTGGITAARAPDWLALSNVLAVGGSWPVPSDLLAERDFAGIAARLAALPQPAPSP